MVPLDLYVRSGARVNFNVDRLGLRAVSCRRRDDGGRFVEARPVVV